MRLSTGDHPRDGAGLTYVYPVVSRRARGVSVGLNLNPNAACNWRCVYCQVPGLTRGAAPEIDLDLLQRELSGLLTEIVRGDFLERRVPAEFRRLNDVALSGDGEPTSSRQLPQVLERVREVLAGLELLGRVEVVLITNGSLVERPWVRAGLELLRGMNGRVWFKLDSATDEGRQRINDAGPGAERALQGLRGAAALCPTWVQTCVFARAGRPPSEEEQVAYLEALARLVGERVPLEGVLLYGLARPSHQPEAPELERLPREWLEGFAARIAALGLSVRVSP